MKHLFKARLFSLILILSLFFGGVGIPTQSTQADALCGSDPNLVGCWLMEEGTGLSLIDASTSGNNGTLAGSPSWVTGKTGSHALYLNGSTHAIVPDSASLDIANQITLAAWVKPEQTTTQNLIKKAINSNTNGYELSLAAAGSAANQKFFVRFNQSTSGDTHRVNSTMNYPADGLTWVHVAATYDGATIKLYIDGVLNNSKAAAISIVTNTLGLGIGADSVGGNKYKGALDDARVYNRALTAEEILALATVPPPIFQTLTVNKTGSGSGTVTSAPAGIDCGPTCSYGFAENTLVTLTASAGVGSSFTGWSGACTGTGDCQVTMDAAQSVNAEFTQAANVFALTVDKTGTGDGTISSDPLGIDCGATCSYDFAENTLVTLTPTPLTGSTFTGWSGACTGTGTCAVTMNAAKSVTAAFALLPPASGLTCTALQPVPATTGTGEKPQSKVWIHDNTWWAVFPTNSSGASSAGTWLWKLQGTTWTDVLKLSDRTDVKADAKPLNDVTHILLYAGTNTQLVSVEYSGGIYQLWTGRSTPSPISLSGSEIATIDIDSTGRMWLATENAANEIIVYHSASPYSTWQGPVTLATGISSDDISVVVALSGKIGVLWSNQNTQRFGFRVHNDTDGPNTWAADEVPASQSALNVGLGMADDHLNLKVASDGTLYAAVKTSYDTANYTKLALLVRRPSGAWDDLYHVDYAGTRGNIELDEVHGVLTYLYTQAEGYNPIVYRQSDLSPIAFGEQQTLRSESFNDVSSTKQNYNNELVVIYGSSTQVGGQICTGTPASGADLAITKDDGLVSIQPNEPVTYTVTVTNNGPESVTGATVADTMPSALTNVNWTCTASGGATCASNGAGDINDVVNLPAGSLLTYNIAGTVNLGARGDLSNTATVTVPGGITDPVTGNNTATDTDAIVTGGGTCESDSNLVGCWQMEEGSGSVLIDGSSFNHDASISGAPAWVTGKVGTYSLDLDGASEYASVPDDASLDITNQITMAAWIKPEEYDTADLIKKATNGGINGYELSLATTKADDSSRKVFFRINQVASGDTYRVNSTTVYPIDGTWIHVAATFDGTTLRMYINGQLESSVDAVGQTIATNNLPLTIGAQDGTAASRWFMGSIDEARVYNRALSLAEIQSLAGIRTYPLTVNKSGAGTGLVTSVPAGIDCGATCTHVFNEDTLVTLTAVPDSGSTFNSWSGANCSGTGTCVVMMDAAKSVTANFESAVLLVSPAGTLAAWNNTFRWTGVSTADFYQLEVYDGSDTLVHSQWFTTSICTGLDCAVSPVETLNLTNGDYKWKVRTYGASGFGEWTTFMNFALDVPTLHLISPTGTLTSWSNTFSWTGTAGADFYQIEVYDGSDTLTYSQWYTTSICTGLDCAVSPAETLSLANGDYKWKVRTYGAGGFGEWAAFLNFSLDVSTLSLISPSGTLTSWDNTFHWTGTSGADFYQIEVLDASDAVLYSQWYTSGICAGLDCSVSPAETQNLANGDYKWKVRTYGVSGFGEWTAFTYLRLDLVTLSLTSPSGTLTSWNNTFRWTGISTADFYQIEVSDANDAVLYSQWYTTGICTGLDCAVSPAETENLANGDYKWKVRTYGSSGFTAWTAFTDFTLDAAEVALVSPTGEQTTWNNTFSWTGISTADFYQLEVHDGSDALVFSQWYTTGICNELDCAISPAETQNLANGDYKWKVRTYGSSGFTAWTDFTNFTLNAAQVVLAAPSGEQTAWGNTFSWAGIADADYYHLEVFDVTDGTVIFDQWYTTTICTSLDCAVSPAETLNLANGDYQWRVQTYGVSGFGSWTPYLDFSLNR